MLGGSTRFAASARLAMAKASSDAGRIVDDTLRVAMTEGVSDVHFEPKENGLRIRFRIDGDMHEFATLPVAMREPVIARIKILGGMDITEKRLPQDGRAKLSGKIHMRLSSQPTVHGEALVLRLLDQAMPILSFEELGLASDQAEHLRAAISGPPGLIYLTGPNGSGKSTTLHSALHAYDTEGRVVCTLEDPIEFESERIRQTEIREKIGLTFAAGLRATLRQNPDIMLVGETRDGETALLSCRAALTGHMVFSTLHTKDAEAAIPRLRDLGVEPFLIAAALKLIAAQRLVRKLCPACKTVHPENKRLAQKYGVENGQFCAAVGCTVCHGRGYKGRIGIYEVVPTVNLTALIAAGAPLAEIGAARTQAGYRTLWDQGLRTAAAGITSLEEVLRVL